MPDSNYILVQLGVRL